MKVEQVEVPYNPADPDHMKHKPLDWTGQAYDMSSPFAFSQGDAAAQTAAPEPSWQVQGYSYSDWYSAPEPQPRMVTECVSAVGVSPNANTVRGFQENTTSAQYRPQQRPPPQQYPPQQYNPGPQYQQPPPSRPLEGWLAKRSEAGISGAWNMRYWRINGNSLIYSRDEQSGEAGRIQLTAKTEIRPLNHPKASVEGRMMGPKKPCAFEIFQGPGLRTYYLDAGGADKKAIWMKALDGVVNNIRQSAWGPQPGGYHR